MDTINDIDVVVGRYIRCRKCKHWIDNEAKCKAFPGVIPFDILSGQFDHTTKHPKQDNDILFEPVEE